MAQHRFVQYNVLSPNLASPSHYERSPPEALGAETRKAKIMEKLEAHISTGAIIALQEIPLEWAGAFTLFFEERGYNLTSTFYGNAFNGHMGVGLAFPANDYQLEDLSVVIPPRTMSRTAQQLKRNQKNAAEAAKKSLGARAKGLLRSLVDMLPFRPIYEPVLRAAALKAGFIKPVAKRWATPIDSVVGRWNRAIFMRLAPADGSAAFAVGTYHMPCMFRDMDVMVVHTALVVQCFEEFVGGDTPRVLLGDFNIKPADPAYEMVVAGHLAADVQARIQQRIFPGWTPTLLSPLSSAYCIAHGAQGADGEPAFTNHTFSGGNPFTGTLDYIFVSSHFGVAEVIETPPLTDETEICPNHEEPSDHILIGATLVLGGDAGSSGGGGGAAASL